MTSTFRNYYDKDLDFFKSELENNCHPFHIHQRAMYQLRMYANLFTRDMRKVLIKNDSICLYCGSINNLQLDHIIPISKGGKNEIENLQILCKNCNRQKSNK